MKYTGSKGGLGVGQWLINNIPAHERYYELFVGSGKLLELKKPALENHINDLNPVIIEYHRAQARQNTYITSKDALSILKYNIWRGGDFIYLDPPYPVDADDQRGTSTILKCSVTVIMCSCFQLHEISQSQ